MRLLVQDLVGHADLNGVRLCLSDVLRLVEGKKSVGEADFVVVVPWLLVYRAWNEEAGALDSTKRLHYVL